MLERHQGPGWLPTGLFIYLIIYLFTIKKQEKKITYTLLFVSIAFIIEMTLFPMAYNAVAFEHIASKHRFRYSMDLFHNTSSKQNLLNMALFAPFGFSLALCCQKLKTYKGIFIIGLTTLGVEVIQLVTSYFSLNTRIFDVDDLLFNLLGGSLAFIAFKLYKKNL